MTGLSWTYEIRGTFDGVNRSNHGGLLMVSGHHLRKKLQQHGGLKMEIKKETETFFAGRLNGQS